METLVSIFNVLKLPGLQGSRGIYIH